MQENGLERLRVCILRRLELGTLHIYAAVATRGLSPVGSFLGIEQRVGYSAVCSGFCGRLQLLQDWSIGATCMWVLGGWVERRVVL